MRSKGKANFEAYPLFSLFYFPNALCTNEQLFSCRLLQFCSYSYFPFCNLSFINCPHFFLELVFGLINYYYYYYYLCICWFLLLRFMLCLSCVCFYVLLCCIYLLSLSYLVILLVTSTLVNEK